MPRVPAVPTYDGPQVRESALQGGFQDAGAYTMGARQTAAAAQGLMQGAEVLDRYAQRQANDAAFKAEVAIKSDWMQTDQQLRQRYRGANVDGYREEVEKWWKEAPAKYGQQFQLDPMARQIASKSLLAAQAQAQAGAMRYFDAEKEKSTVENFEAAKNVTRQMALTDGSEAAVNTARSDIMAKNATEAARRGMSPEQLQAMNLADTTRLHLEYIGSLTEQHPQEAKRYYEAHRDEIDASRHAYVEKVLKAETDNQQAQQLAASWATLPLDEQLKKASEVSDPDLQDKVLRRVQNNAGLVARAQQEAEKRASDQAWHFVTQGKRVPEAILQAMDGKESAQLKDYLRRQSEHEVDRAYTLQRRGQILAGGSGGGGGGKIKTNGEVHAQLWALMANDPEKFAELPLEAYRFDLSQSDLEQLMSKQMVLKKGTAKAEGKEVVTMTQQLSAATESLKGAAKARFMSTAQDYFEEHKERTGKAPTYEERKKIIDRLFIDGEVASGHWWQPDRNTPFYMLKPSERTAFVQGTVPAKDKAEIEQVLKSKGIPVTPENVLDMFNRKRNQ